MRVLQKVQKQTQENVNQRPKKGLLDFHKKSDFPIDLKSVSMPIRILSRASYTVIYKANKLMKRGEKPVRHFFFGASKYSKLTVKKGLQGCFINSD